MTKEREGVRWISVCAGPRNENFGGCGEIESTVLDRGDVWKVMGSHKVADMTRWSLESRVSSD